MRILVWQAALVVVLAAIAVALIGVAAGHYVWSDTGTLKAQLAAARQQAAAANQETAAARLQAAAAGQQAASMRTQATASRLQLKSMIAADELHRLMRTQNVLQQAVAKNARKNCLSRIERRLARARRPADRLYAAQSYPAAASAYSDVIGQAESKLRKCDPAVRATIRSLD